MRELFDKPTRKSRPNLRVRHTVRKGRKSDALHAMMLVWKRWIDVRWQLSTLDLDTMSALISEIVVLDAGTVGLPDQNWQPLDALGNVVRYEATDDDDALILERIRTATIVLTNKVPIRATVFQSAAHLQMIGVLATGYNVIDLFAACQAGVTICNVPGYSTASVAQHAFALLLALTNSVCIHDRSVQDGDWCRSDRFSYWLNPLHELHGRTMGILGFGAIGRRVAEIARAFGMTVIAASRSKRDDPGWPGFRWMSTDQLFEDSDVVSLHCPETRETTGIVNEERLARMKPSAILINTARGGLIDEAALARALYDGRLAGAGLDVLAFEPMRSGCPLRGAPNCIITPHIAWATYESRARLLAAVIDNVRAFLSNAPINVVGTKER